MCTNTESKREKEKGWGSERERDEFLFIFRLSHYCLYSELFTKQQFYSIHTYKHLDPVRGVHALNTCTFENCLRLNSWCHMVEYTCRSIH